METPNERSLVVRGAVALALLLGFYLLALGIAGVLVWAMIFTTTESGVRVWFIPAIATTYAIATGIFFIERRDQAPAGFRIDARSEPRLMDVVTEVAGAMSTKVPHEVYLIPDVNAFVYEQGRIFGLVRTKRIMGIGLALINVLRVDELRSVLAHEYGHYAGGDTKLGGLIYRARASLERTMSHLRGGILRETFAAYGRLFLRLTQRISRDQELAADASAVRIAGARAHSSALRSVAGAGGAFDAFMEDYVVPLWRENHRPDNLYAGFRSFLTDPQRREQIVGYVDVVKSQEHEFDSHPSLERRLANIPHVDLEGNADPRLARDLLVHPDTTERRMTEVVSELAVPDGMLVPVGWDETGPLLAVRLRAAADRLVDALGSDGLDIEGDRLPRIVLVLERADAAKIVRRLVPLQNYPQDDVDSIVRDTLHYYVAATMTDDLVARRGYRMQPSWSRPFLVTGRDGRTVDVGERVGSALETRDLRSLLRSL